jgi:hypothetical protein
MLTACGRTVLSACCGAQLWPVQGCRCCSLPEWEQVPVSDSEAVMLAAVEIVETPPLGAEQARGHVGRQSGEVPGEGLGSRAAWLCARQATARRIGVCGYCCPAAKPGSWAVTTWLACEQATAIVPPAECLTAPGRAVARPARVVTTPRACLGWWQPPEQDIPRYFHAPQRSRRAVQIRRAVPGSPQSPAAPIQHATALPNVLPHTTLAELSTTISIVPAPQPAGVMATPCWGPGWWLRPAPGRPLAAQPAGVRGRAALLQRRHQPVPRD